MHAYTLAQEVAVSNFKKGAQRLSPCKRGLGKMLPVRPHGLPPIDRARLHIMRASSGSHDGEEGGVQAAKVAPCPSESPAVVCGRLWGGFPRLAPCCCFLCHCSVWGSGAGMRKVAVHAGDRVRRAKLAFRDIGRMRLVERRGAPRQTFYVSYVLRPSRAHGRGDGGTDASLLRGCGGCCCLNPPPLRCVPLCRCVPLLSWNPHSQWRYPFTAPRRGRSLSWGPIRPLPSLNLHQQALARRPPCERSSSILYLQQWSTTNAGYVGVWGGGLGAWVLCSH